jgi:ribosomal-protein-serine acetyltransferase
MFQHEIDSHTQLRSLTFADADQFFRLAFENRKYLGEWMFWLDDNYSLLDAQRHIKLALQRAEAKNGFEAGIWLDGNLAGCIRFNYIDWEHKNTELGYWLGASFQGRGLAIRACRIMINHAFSELGLHRVEIRCIRENSRSRRIPVKLGFVEEGILREVRLRRGTFNDHVVYGMLTNEWQPHN